MAKLRFRVSMSTLLMLILTSAAASALFAKVRQHSEMANQPSWKTDSPILVTAAIATTAIALGAIKSHSAVQTMFQATIAFLGYLSLIWLAEGGWMRILVYWYQVAFAMTVAFPLLARRLVKTEMDKGPRRDWWKRTFEASVFAFLNMQLCVVGVLIQFTASQIGGQMMPTPAAVPAATPGAAPAPATFPAPAPAPLPSDIPGPLPSAVH